MDPLSRARAVLVVERPGSKGQGRGLLGSRVPRSELEIQRVLGVSKFRVQEGAPAIGEEIRELGSGAGPELDSCRWWSQPVPGLCGAGVPG